MYHGSSGQLCSSPGLIRASLLMITNQPSMARHEEKYIYCQIGDFVIKPSPSSPRSSPPSLTSSRSSSPSLTSSRSYPPSHLYPSSSHSLLFSYLTPGTTSTTWAWPTGGSSLGSWWPISSLQAFTAGQLGQEQMDRSSSWGRRWSGCRAASSTCIAGMDGQSRP